MSRSEQLRRQALYLRARRRWQARNPARAFTVDHSAVYLAPAALLSELLTVVAEREREGGAP